MDRQEEFFTERLSSDEQFLHNMFLFHFQITAACGQIEK